MYKESIPDIFAEKDEMRLKDLCADEMPREKLMSKGAESLSNTELLAILLRTGRDGVNVIDMARELLKSGDGSLNGLAEMSVNRLCTINGIGPGKAITVAAAFELGRRASVEAAGWTAETIASAEKVFRIMQPVVKDLDHEQCWAVFLNRSNRLICKELISSGGFDSTVIDNRMIIHKAIDRKASAMILVHNHPSGNALPSAADIEMTKMLNKALKICDISLLDHIIIAKASYYSFADENLQSLAIVKK